MFVRKRGSYVRTPEHREHMRRLASGKRKPHSAAAKANMKAKAYKRTSEHKALQRAKKLGVKNPKISAAMKGKKKTREHCDKIAVTLRRKYPPTVYQDSLSRRYAQNLARQILQAGRPKPDNCEICGRTARICFDHDHTTGLFRGWICNACNSALGLVSDSTDILEKLIAYLRKQ